ncbi:MAG: HD domain-containing phosphohydrolase [Candidatus Brocadiia bacterium]
METSRFNTIQVKFEKLLRLAAAFTSEYELDRLLDKIIKASVELTDADAGSLYLREKRDGQDRLFFCIALNNTLSKRHGKPLTSVFNRGTTISVGENSLAGYVAKTKTPLNIPDAYALAEDAPYRHNREFDKTNGYECHSMLLHPMIDRHGEVVGVIQLINARYKGVPGTMESFNKEDEEVVSALSSLAAEALQRAMLIEEVYRAYVETMQRMAVMVELKLADPDTHVHIHRIAEYAVEVADELGLSDDFKKALRDAAPMHDIGKQAIPDAILLKPGKLTPEEFDIVKRHTSIGAKLFEGKNEPIARSAYNITLCHHEKYDGTGYPNGIKGEAIPIEARIVAVVDVFDALFTDRVYKKAMPLDMCISILKKDTGTHFDPDCVVAFLKRLDRILEIREKFERIKAAAAPVPPPTQ